MALKNVKLLLDLEIEVRQLYHHLSIPMMPEQAKEDDES